MAELMRREMQCEFPVEKVSCPRCGKEHQLWFNGGELDEKKCCGLVLYLEHVRIDVVIADDEPST